LTFYKNSDALTEKTMDKIQHVIYWSIMCTIISIFKFAGRNNHVITSFNFELLFPFIPETKNGLIKGRAWFEKEIAYQIYGQYFFLGLV
jgi:hypothetical protein